MSILRMALSSKMDEARSAISTALFTALEFGGGDDDGYIVRPGPTEQFSTMHPKVAGTSGSICFVVRRPG
jgi:hypothetical protein